MEPLHFNSRMVDATAQALTNFRRCNLKVEGRISPSSVEHEYQALKFERAFHDPVYADVVRHAATPKEAKKAGSKGAWVQWMKEHHPQRTKVSLSQQFKQTIARHWIPISDRVMLELLRQKFDKTMNEDLHVTLLRTGRRMLHEVGRPNHWTQAGDDMLGKLIMTVRDELE